MRLHANACAAPTKRTRMRAWGPAARSAVGRAIFGPSTTLSGRQTRAQSTSERVDTVCRRSEPRATRAHQAPRARTKGRPTSSRSTSTTTRRGLSNGSGLEAAPTRTTTHQRPPQARRTRLAGAWWVVGGQWLVWRSMSAASSSAPMCAAISSTCSRSTSSACSAHAPLTW